MARLFDFSAFSFFRRLSKGLCSGGYCKGCRYFVQINGRRYGLCTRGGPEVLECRGHWPKARNWPWPLWRCSYYHLSDEYYRRWLDVLAAAKRTEPDDIESELERVHGTADPVAVFGGGPEDEEQQEDGWFELRPIQPDLGENLDGLPFSP